MVVVGFRMLREWHESVVALHNRFFHPVEMPGSSDFLLSPLDVADIIAVPCSSQLASVCSDFDVFRGIDHVIRQCQPFCASIARLVACFLAVSLHFQTTAFGREVINYSGSNRAFRGEFNRLCCCSVFGRPTLAQQPLSQQYRSSEPTPLRSDTLPRRQWNRYYKSFRLFSIKP